MALDKNDATSYDNDAPDKAHSSSGPGRRPLKAEITGSTPVCATNPVDNVSQVSLQAAWDFLFFCYSPVYSN